jgi:hypothetical protein
MDAPDLLGTGEIGDGPCNSEHSMEAAGGQMHCRGSIGEKLAARLIGSCNPVEQFAVRLSVRSRTMAVVSIGLDLARCSDAFCNLHASLRWRRKREVCSRDSGHLDVEVDAVEQRPRYARLVVGRAPRRAAACQRRITQMTAPAGVHRRDELDSRRECDVRVGAGDADAAGLERFGEANPAPDAGTPAARRGTRRRGARG